MNITKVFFAMMPLMQPIAALLMEKKIPKETGYYIEKKEVEIQGQKRFVIFEQTAYATDEEASKHLEIQNAFNDLVKTVQK